MKFKIELEFANDYWYARYDTCVAYGRTPQQAVDSLLSIRDIQHLISGLEVAA